MTAPTPLTGPFAHILEANRTRFNAKFAEARHTKPKLSPEAFKQHLHFTLAPIIEAVHQQDADKANGVADALYDLSLDLVGQELLGPQARHPLLVESWQTLLPRVPRFIIEAPRAFVGAVTNAVHNLSVTAGARPREWLDIMRRAATLCPDSATFLRVGQIAAWRSGLAHHRSEALALAAQLATTGPMLARLALNLPTANTKTAPLITTLLNRLNADPWYRPESSPTHPKLAIVARVGAFRGFGGLFLAPPRVFLKDGHFVIQESEAGWLLAADAFGATLHRHERPTASDKVETPFRLEADGKVSHGRLGQVFPELAQATSLAATATTLAVTTALSHAVYLVAVVV
jgi:hypothetical protein